MKHINGGVCAPKGFMAAGIHSGIKHNPKKNDLAVIVSEKPCSVAATFTTNKVKAAPLYVNMEHIKNKTAQMIIANSGNANACAPYGKENAEKMCQLAADNFGVDFDDVLVASTGVIGVTLDVAPIENAVPKLKELLSKDGSDMAATAIMTTDTYKKEISIETEIGGKTVKLGAIAKGSGMIHPNMGTMLSFITTDCNVSSEVLEKLHKEIVKKTYNRVSVDGDTSTNDMCIVMANGMAENEEIASEGEAYDKLKEALFYINTYLAHQIARDGEGSTRLVSCTVKNAKTEEKAEILAKSVASSSLVKTAMFGSDANWGRVICAMGYSGAEFDPAKTDISFCSSEGEILVCKDGVGLAFDEELAKKILLSDEVIILADIKEGEESVTAWGCDLTYDYVKINGDYRS